MPNFGKGKSSHGVSLEDMVVGPIVIAGKAIRDAGEHGVSLGWRGIQMGWDRMGLTGHTSNKGSDGEECLNTCGGFSIRVRQSDRQPGANNQLICPRLRADRCGNCVVNLTGREDFPFSTAGSCVDIALGISEGTELT
jgi:hypothetical protein